MIRGRPKLFIGAMACRFKQGRVVRQAQQVTTWSIGEGGGLCTQAKQDGKGPWFETEDRLWVLGDVKYGGF